MRFSIAIAAQNGQDILPHRDTRAVTMEQIVVLPGSTNHRRDSAFHAIICSEYGADPHGDTRQPRPRPGDACVWHGCAEWQAGLCVLVRERCPRHPCGILDRYGGPVPFESLPVVPGNTLTFAYRGAGRSMQSHCSSTRWPGQARANTRHCAAAHPCRRRRPTGRRPSPHPPRRENTSSSSASAARRTSRQISSFISSSDKKVPLPTLDEFV